jgi:hypothetical protein
VIAREYEDWREPVATQVKQRMYFSYGMHCHARAVDKLLVRVGLHQFVQVPALAQYLPGHKRMDLGVWQPGGRGIFAL